MNGKKDEDEKNEELLTPPSFLLVPFLPVPCRRVRWLLSCSLFAGARLGGVYHRQRLRNEFFRLVQTETFKYVINYTDV